MRIGRFEQADGGTLFLDEVGDMSPSTQAKILRVLQEQEFERLGGTRAIKVDVADHRGDQPQPRRRWCRTGGSARTWSTGCTSCRSTCRRCVDRKDDIPLLAQHFLHRFAAESKQAPRRHRTRRGQGADAPRLAGQHPRARERRSSAPCCCPKGRSSTVGRPADRRRASRGRPSTIARRPCSIPPSGISLEEIERQARARSARACRTGCRRTPR